MRKFFSLVLVVLVAVAASAADKKAAAKNVVDAGSFGVFVGGRRVATEKFSIEQRGEVNVATTELTMLDDSGSKPTQATELQLSAAGDLVHYLWRDVAGQHAQAVVEPDKEFLIERISLGADDKAAEVPFLLPHSTMILDDYTFVQRQILAWRYLASVCAPNPQGQLACRAERAQYGILIPQQRVSSSVYLTLKGKEKVTIRGAERDLSRINLESDAGDWTMWFDENNKLVRIFVAAQNTEILRD